MYDENKAIQTKKRQVTTDHTELSDLQRVFGICGVLSIPSRKSFLKIICSQAYFLGGPSVIAKLAGTLLAKVRDDAPSLITTLPERKRIRRGARKNKLSLIPDTGRHVKGRLRNRG